jgi:hypothetical protein
MRELYIYYRVNPQQAVQAEDEVRALHAELREQFTGLTARRLLRADAASSASSQTWMEIYAHPSGLSDLALAVILKRGTELVRSIDGPRHPEVFSPCA